jgi:hypothetical protein
VASASSRRESIRSRAEAPRHLQPLPPRHRLCLHSGALAGAADARQQEACALGRTFPKQDFDMLAASTCNIWNLGQSVCSCSIAGRASLNPPLPTFNAATGALLCGSAGQQDGTKERHISHLLVSASSRVSASPARIPPPSLPRQDVGRGKASKGSKGWFANHRGSRTASMRELLTWEHATGAMEVENTTGWVWQSIRWVCQALPPPPAPCRYTCVDSSIAFTRAFVVVRECVRGIMAFVFA